MLRGAETAASTTRRDRDAGGDGVSTAASPATSTGRRRRSATSTRLRNAYDDRVSISIHVYGANIGAATRHVFDATSGAAKHFVSGYSSAMLPNFWDRSGESAA